MATRHLSQIELAARWNISHRTLERWRWTGEGPKFIKLGGRVIYRLEDVEAALVQVGDELPDGAVALAGGAERAVVLTNEAFHLVAPSATFAARGVPNGPYQ